MTSPFLEPISGDMRAVDTLVRQRLHSDVALVSQIGDYIVSAGGKRLRPALLLLMWRALNPQATEPDSRALLLAAVVEFIHTATLLHDDVVDESALRRGRSTANALFGNAASVLVGDFLYSRAFQMMVEVDSVEVMRILADATNTIAEGEVLQLLNCRDPNVDESRYRQVILYKTAKLFEAAAELAAVVSGAPTPLRNACAEYGRRMGTAFQLIDDVLDYSSDSEAMGKNVGDDLREGKPTLPLIAVLARGNDVERQLVRSAIEAGDDSQFVAIFEAIQRTGALDYARAAAQQEADAAQALLADLPSSLFKDSLISLSAFSVSRKN